MSLLDDHGERELSDGRVIHAPGPGEDGPHVGSFDVEEIYNFDTDKCDWRKLKVPCPHCARVNCPWLSPYLRHANSGWDWMGLEYRYPYSEWTCRCRCGGWYRFKTFVPQ